MPRPRCARDRDDAIVAGVCAALARRLGIDPVIVRVGFALVVIASAGVALLGLRGRLGADPGDGDRPTSRSEARSARRGRAATGGSRPASAC